MMTMLSIEKDHQLADLNPTWLRVDVINSFFNGWSRGQLCSRRLPGGQRQLSTESA